jgi:internalin A
LASSSGGPTQALAEAQTALSSKAIPHVTSSSLKVGCGSNIARNSGLRLVMLRGLTMARDRYQEAERKIDAAQRAKAKDLDLSGRSDETLTLPGLPKSLGQLTHLQSLNLSGNKLTTLPEWLTQLTQLRSLNISGNQLVTVPDWLTQLPHLQSLNLSGNKLTTLPEWLAQLTRLQALDLASNQLTVLPEWLGRFTDLQSLDVQSNQLESLPSSLQVLTQLRSLACGNNPLFPLVPDWLDRLQRLQWFHFSNIPLQVFPEIVLRLAHLETLFLNHNGLSSLPSDIGRLERLTSLFLNSNQLNDLPVSVAQLKNLTSLRLEQNPLLPELAAAYKEGLESVKSYLRAKAEPQVALNEAKLILVGEGEVGKSCLLGALRGDPWEEGRATTHGIEIKPVKVTDPATETEITLNGWDFGGQRVYRPTHQLFFSAPAVYLVVWKPREGSQQGFVKEWIKLVKHREPDAKILVVATHGGPKECQPDIDRQEIWDLFGKETVIDFFFVDSKTDPESGKGDGVFELKTAIGRIAASLPEMGRQVPKTWQGARLELQELNQPYIATERALEICSNHKIEEDDARRFLTIEHRLGRLIHYAHDPILRDIVVLKPDWLATAISLVLDDKTTRDAHGLVSFERLGQLWDDPMRSDELRYPSELHPVFVKLMERYDLSYRVASLSEVTLSESVYLISQLVPDVRPVQIGGWTETVPAGEEEQIQICRIVETHSGQSANAEGLFYQLIVRLHRFSLGRADYNQSSHWQRGLVLDDDYNGRALLEYMGNDVRITVRAAYPEAFLSVLTHEVKWQVESFWRGMRCEVVVPCVDPCGKKQPGIGVFEVQKLIAFKRQGMDVFPCFTSGCNQLQSIDRLLRNAPSARPSAAVELQAEYKEFREELKSVRGLLVEQHGAAMDQFQGLNVATKRIMSKVDDVFKGIMTALTDEAKEGPRLFNMEPAEPGFFGKPKWLAQKFRIALWCEHSRLPVWALGDDKQGVYEMDVPRDWFVRAAPFLRILGTTLSLALPVASAATKVLLDDAIFKGIEKQLDLGQKSVESLVKGGENIGGWLIEDDSPDIQNDARVRAEGAVLRQLHAWLKEKDPGFGGLVRVQNKRQEFLWVHPMFEAEY